MNPKRMEIIRTTADLIEVQGYHATGINQIIAESGAPKGSLYHYFPGGKDELMEEAIYFIGETLSDLMRDEMSRHKTAAEAVPAFLRLAADMFHESDYSEGGHIITIAMETSSVNERLQNACHQVNNRFLAIIDKELLSSGFSETRSKQLASVTLSLLEGAIVMSRTSRTKEPLLLAADELEVLLKK